MASIEATLEERATRYGSFEGHARITYELKRAMQAAPKWPDLADDQREALDMIVHKIGRILNGDPNYHDSWHDIVGYAKLVADRLLQTTNGAGRVSAPSDEAAAVRALTDARKRGKGLGERRARSLGPASAG